MEFIHKVIKFGFKEFDWSNLKSHEYFIGEYISPLESDYYKKIIEAYNNSYAEYSHNDELEPPYMSEDYAERRKLAVRATKELNK